MLRRTSKPGRYSRGDKAFRTRFGALATLPGAIMPDRPKRQKRVGVEREADLQRMAESYCEVRGAFYFRIPDEALRMIFANPQIPVHQKARVAEHFRGMPDLTLMHGGRYLALELKARTGKMRQGQLHVQAAIGTIVCRTFDEVKGAIDGFLDG